MRCCEWKVEPTPFVPAHSLVLPAVEDAVASRQRGDVARAETLCLMVLELLPGNTQALKLLASLRENDQPAATEALLGRVIVVNPDDWEATDRLAQVHLRRNNHVEAEVHARNAVRIAPENPQSHNLLGVLLTETNRPQFGEYHHRRAIELVGRREPNLLANLALNLKNQGKIDAARELYRQMVEEDAATLDTLLAAARLEEADRQIEAASALIARCEAIAPDNPQVMLQRAILHGRSRSYGEAIALLEGRSLSIGEQGVGPSELLEKGRLLDQTGRHDDAFAAFAQGKALLSSSSGMRYHAEAAEQQAQRLQGFFTRSRLAILPRAGVAPGAQPIFVVGFPRSGTTLVEQMLSSHSRISAGDELPFINELAAVMPRLFGSPLLYPEALAELWMGDHREGLDDLRDHYLSQARRYGVTAPGVDWFTDKMPLNETHLGLISLVFPASPIVHVLRHPLDVALSVFSNQLTHGFYCANALESVARHYALTFELVEHYKAQLDIRYLAVRYEDLVVDPMTHISRILAFADLPFEKRCLRFEENQRYARTASYAQVTEKLYDRSRYRYRRYREHLMPIVPILRPMIDRLGYSLD